MRLSAGTAACIGLANNRMDAFPTTAYLLSGDQCKMKCSFCPRGNGESKTLNRLGRITWPEYDWSVVENELGRAGEKGIKRICLQSVRYDDGILTLLENIKKVKAASKLPLSLSAWLSSEDEAVALVEAGAERISISLDVINPQAYQEIKGGVFLDRLNLLLDCADNLPGRLSTHLICGLGETEDEALSLIDKLVQADITIALFAFIPLRGTPLAMNKPPAIDSYRRVQAGYYLLHEKAAQISDFTFNNGRLVSYGLPEEKLFDILADGRAFQTSGCPDCNRPYYNEHPGGTIYNYHRPLSSAESREAILALGQK